MLALKSSFRFCHLTQGGNGSGTQPEALLSPAACQPCPSALRLQHMCCICRGPAGVCRMELAHWPWEHICVCLHTQDRGWWQELLIAGTKRSSMSSFGSTDGDRQLATLPAGTRLRVATSQHPMARWDVLESWEPQWTSKEHTSPSGVTYIPWFAQGWLSKRQPGHLPACSCPQLR